MPMNAVLCGFSYMCSKYPKSILGVNPPRDPVGLKIICCTELRRKRNRRHVWAVDGDLLKAIPVVVGLSSNQYTEVVSGELKEGDTLVTGILAKQ